MKPWLLISMLEAGCCSPDNMGLVAVEYGLPADLHAGSSWVQTPDQHVLRQADASQTTQLISSMKVGQPLPHSPWSGIAVVLQACRPSGSKRAAGSTALALKPVRSPATLAAGPADHKLWLHKSEHPG